MGGLQPDSTSILATHSIPTFRRWLLQLLGIIVPLGVASKFYAGPAQGWVRGQAGGILYVAFWIVLVLLARPNLPLRIVAVTVLAITCILEVAQLWQPPALVAIRTSFVGHALIGSTFSWWDFPNYVLGAILGFVLVHAARTRAYGGQRPQSVA
jgi:hypothetical protein